MRTIDKKSFFWNYLSCPQQGLLDEGLYLLNDLEIHPDVKITDYSYLVFPFAKAYEGFLKKLFLDLGYISPKDYESDHFRIGKALNPHLEKVLRHQSVYDKVVSGCGNNGLAFELWDVWKRGRNLVFHYFPHSFKALSFAQAQKIIEEIISVMEKSIFIFRLKLNASTPETYRPS